MADTVTHTASEPAEPSRRDFINILATTATIGGVAAVAWPLVDQLNPAADTLALASLEFDLTKVALGQEVTISWRKQPVFVRHRTPAEIDRREVEVGCAGRRLGSLPRRYLPERKPPASGDHGRMPTPSSTQRGRSSCSRSRPASA